MLAHKKPKVEIARPTCPPSLNPKGSHELPIEYATPGPCPKPKGRRSPKVGKMFGKIV